MATVSSDEARELMAQIARIAPAKRHRLAADMVDGRRQLTVASARMVLEHLRKCPDLPGQAQAPAAVPPQAAPAQGRPLPRLEEFKDIPKGYYATPSATGSNDLDYWRVTKGKPGTQWEGYSFVRRVLGGGSGDDMRYVELTNIQQRLALQAITVTGIEQAQNSFADTLERCVDCGLFLTDADSRAARRGRVCRDKKASRDGAA